MRRLLGQPDNLHKVLRLFVASLILGVPLYPKFPFLQIPSTYVSVRLEDFLILITSLLWLIYLVPRYKKLLKNKIVQAILLFWLVGFVSVISAIVITQTIVPHIGILHWARRIEYMLCFFIGYSVIRSKKDLAFYIKCLVVVVLYAFLYGVAQKYIQLPVITTQNFEYSKGLALRFMPGGHMVSTFAGHYDLASFLIMVIPFMVTLPFLPAKGIKQSHMGSSVFLIRLVFLLGYLASFWLLINTVSRISVAAFFIATITTLWLARRYKVIPIFLITSLIVVFTSTSLIGRYSRVFDVYFQKIIKTSAIELVSTAYAIESPAPSATPYITPVPQPVFEDRSTSIRLAVEWPRAIRAFTKNPLVGTGYSSITLATDNDYLRLLGEAGALGFLAFGLIFVRLGKEYFSSLAKIRRPGFDSVFVASMIGATLGVLVTATFIDIFEASKFAILFWLLSGFAIKTLKNIKNEEKNI